MNTLRISLAVFLLCLSVSGAHAQSRAELPSDFTIELLGRCIIYSISYQYTFEQQFGVEVGASVLGGTDETIIFLSGGGRVYLTKKNAAPCIGAGFVAVTAPTSSGPFSDDNSATYFYIGPGFEYRSDGGFVVRGTVNFLIRSGFFVWPGVQLGVAF